MALAKVSEYRSKIMKMILDDQEVAKALYYNVPNFLSQPDLDEDIRYGMSYINIFPFIYVPDTKDEAMTFISMSIQMNRQGDDFQAGSITLNAMTHQSLMRTVYGQSRTDFISYKLEQILNGARDFGLGDLRYNSSGDTVVSNSKFVGVVNNYDNLDFIEPKAML